MPSSRSHLHYTASRPVLAALICLLPATSIASELTGTFYVGRISSVPAWHDLISDPANVEFVDAHVAVAALSKVLRTYSEDRLAFEGEAQVGYNFGDQSHWEFNVAAGPRWRAFPWNHIIDTTAAFALGLSMASEVPEVEVQLEGDSERLLIYWVAELTFGLPQREWDLSLRLHHRSPAFGLLGDDGGMNAVALGVRHRF